ncbi:hypothetical protein CTAM01_01752, partial [Colletotrichum tamarilloi]
KPKIQGQTLRKASRVCLFPPSFCLKRTDASGPLRGLCGLQISCFVAQLCFALLYSDTVRCSKVVHTQHLREIPLCIGASAKSISFHGLLRQHTK